MPGHLDLGDHRDAQSCGVLYHLADLRPSVVATIGTGCALVYELAILLPEGVPVVGHTVGCLLGQ